MPLSWVVLSRDGVRARVCADPFYPSHNYKMVKPAKKASGGTKKMTPYNAYMKKELASYKAAHPGVNHQEAFKKVSAPFSGLKIIWGKMAVYHVCCLRIGPLCDVVTHLDCHGLCRAGGFHVEERPREPQEGEVSHRVKTQGLTMES